jgi:hypothetical protein
MATSCPMSGRAAKAAALAIALAGCSDLERRLDALDARWSKVEDEQLAAATAGRVPGTPVDCVPARAGLQIAGGALVANEGPLLYVNANDRRCAGVAIDPLVIVEPLTGPQICVNDRFRTVPRNTSIPGPFCRIGQWTPYRRIDPPRPIRERSG